MLAPADDEILAASADLEKIANQAVSATREALSAKIRDVAAQLGKLLQQGHALAACSIPLHDFLLGTTLANPAGRPFIAGYGMTLDAETEFLDRTWRNNPEALALFEAHIPRTAVANRMRVSVRKIKDERDRAQHLANQAAAARHWANPQRQSFEPRAPYEPPKSTFVSESYTL